MIIPTSTDKIMASPLENPTWVLLPPGNLPPASQVPKLLGAIVADFEAPTLQFQPHDVETIRGRFESVLMTGSKDFDTALGGGISDDVILHLGELLSTEYKTELSNKRALKSKFIITWTLVQAKAIFDAIKSSHENEILEMIKTNPKRHKGAVYMVVGIKVCLDAETEAEAFTSRQTGGDLGVPINSIIAAATGMILPVNVSAGIGVHHGIDLNHRTSQVVCGARIFAIQYRIIMTNQSWRSWPKRRPIQAQYGDFKTVPKGKGFYQGEDGEEGEEEEGESGPEELAIGSLSSSDSLKPQNSGVVVSHLE